jgi:type IV secretory pathway VirB3-like protein
MPRQFAYRGERLAFNSGIVALALIASLVVVAFRGRVEALIPLYAIGVFTAFTLSQAGMVRHWLVEQSEGWRRSAVINGIGAIATGIVAVVFAVAKFALGAWIVIVIVPILVVIMLLIRREYRMAVVPLQDMRRDAIQAIKFGLTISDDVVAVHVTDDLFRANELRKRFEHQVHGVDLVVLESPYRELVQPFIRYLEMLAARDADTVTIVLVPERIIRHWWERLLYNRNSHRIRDALTGHPGILVADLPFRRAA